MEKIVKCVTCEIEFDLLKAKLCDHNPIKTMMCPNGHCICNLPIGNFRPSTKEEQKFGFVFMLKQEFGGLIEDNNLEKEIEDIIKDIRIHTNDFLINARITKDIHALKDFTTMFTMVLDHQVFKTLKEKLGEKRIIEICNEAGKKELASSQP